VKIAPDGSLLWDASFGGEGTDRLEMVLATGDGFVLGGLSSSRPSGNKTARNYGRGDFWLVKIDGMGAKQWDQSCGGSDLDWLRALVGVGDKLVLAGTSYSGPDGVKTTPQFGVGDYWVIQIPSSVPPRIEQQPQSATVSGGAAVSFSVFAFSTSPLRYRWRFNGVDIPGATNAVLSLSDVQAGQAGRYSVLVSNEIGAVESEAAVLTYTDAASLLLTLHPSLTIYGTAGKTYRVEYADQPTGVLEWRELGSVLVTNSPQVFVDLQSPVRGSRLYRVVLAP